MVKIRKFTERVELSVTKIISDREWVLSFNASSSDDVGNNLPVSATIHNPRFLVDMQAWSCFIEWSGGFGGCMTIYGASPIQALRLSLHHLDIELSRGVGRHSLFDDDGIWAPPSDLLTR